MKSVSLNQFFHVPSFEGAPNHELLQECLGQQQTANRAKQLENKTKTSKPVKQNKALTLQGNKTTSQTGSEPGSQQADWAVSVSAAVCLVSPDCHVRLCVW